MYKVRWSLVVTLTNRYNSIITFMSFTLLLQRRSIDLLLPILVKKILLKQVEGEAPTTSVCTYY